MTRTRGLYRFAGDRDARRMGVLLSICSVEWDQPRRLMRVCRLFVLCDLTAILAHERARVGDFALE